MLQFIRRVALSALAVTLVAIPAAAQQVTLRDLPKALKEIEDPFSLILGATEFKPGQVLVVDGIEATVTLVNFATGAKTVLGRKGAGPGEYTVPAGVMMMPGDTIVVFDAGSGGGAAARIVKYLPDLKAGTTTNMMLFNTTDSTIIQGTMFPDATGRVYSTSIKLVPGPTGVTPADSMKIVRFDLQATPVFTTLAAIRTPQSGAQQRQVEGTKIRVRTPFSGLVNADAWTLLPDGTIAVIRGNNYTVEFIGRDGRKTPPVAIPYDRIRVTEPDKAAELEAQRKQVADVMSIIRKTLPPNFTLDLEIIPPPSWPAEYPPVAAIVAYPSPNGQVWVKRSTPTRVGREQWDVIDRTGKLAARWQLPPKTTLVAVGNGSVYTVRTDEDDLRYVQHVQLPACRECGPTR